jgi:hypothetical protein
MNISLFLFMLGMVLACPSNFHGGTSAGNMVVPKYGKVVVIGDSLLDGSGSTAGMVEGTLSSLLDNTTVQNNAIGGLTMQDIANELPSCSCEDDCKWSVINGGINGMYQQSVEMIVNEMKSVVQRELQAPNVQGVIIQGYVPDCIILAFGGTFNSIMDSYSLYATKTEKVWFVDPRYGLPGHPLLGIPCADTNYIYRVESDKSHPTPLSGQVMATAIANIIKRNSNDENNNDTDNNNEDQPPETDENLDEGQGDANSQGSASDDGDEPVTTVDPSSSSGPGSNHESIFVWIMAFSFLFLNLIM